MLKSVQFPVVAEGPIQRIASYRWLSRKSMIAALSQVLGIVSML